MYAHLKQVVTHAIGEREADATNSNTTTSATHRVP
jgi:hypothetical protein